MRRLRPEMACRKCLRRSTVFDVRPNPESSVAAGRAGSDTGFDGFICALRADDLVSANAKPNAGASNFV